VKFVVLSGIFIVLPELVYSQFEKADDNLRALVIRGIQHQGRLTAQALSPLLDRPGRPPGAELGAELAKYADDGTVLQLMLKPDSGGSAGRFYFVSSWPAVAADQLGAELGGLEANGVLDQLSKSCDGDVPVDVRYRTPAGEQMMSQLAPIKTRWGCWILVSSHSTAEYLYMSVARPLWMAPESRIAAGIYVLAAIVMALVVVGVARSLRHFRNVASEIRQGRPSHPAFASRNVVPELNSVAADFDALTLDLRNVARDIRQAAEDNAHSFKSPVAAIEASLEMVRRSLESQNQPAQRAFELIGGSIQRLKALISASQHLDNITADLIEAPRQRVDLASIVEGVLERFRDVVAERGVGIACYLPEKVFVQGSAQILDVAIENIVDNAISFSPPGSTIQVTLATSSQLAELRIDDEGPGIDPDKIDRIFDRYFSLRPAPVADEDWEGPLAHSGLGLWIVRRNIEALGGTVTASNLTSGGLRIRIALPLNRRWKLITRDRAR
jgi:two-component system sensor histidine kinase ChvG